MFIIRSLLYTVLSMTLMNPLSGMLAPTKTNTFAYTTHSLKEVRCETNQMTAEAFDEKNNRVIVRSYQWKPDSETLGGCKLRVVKLGTGYIQSFPTNGPQIISKDGTRMVSLDIDNNMHVTRDWHERSVCCTWDQKNRGSVSGFGLNNQEIIMGDHTDKASLLNIDTKTIIHNNADQIQCDQRGKICLVQNGSNVTLFKRGANGNHHKKHSFENIAYAYLNPNGKQLFVEHQNGTKHLISADGNSQIDLECSRYEHTLDNHSHYIKDCIFSDDGKYIVVYQQKDTALEIVETCSGRVCLRFQRNISPHIFFEHNYLVFIPHCMLDNSNVRALKCYLIDINTLNTLDDNTIIYSPKEMKHKGIAHSFKNVMFSMLSFAKNEPRFVLHPNQKHIVQWGFGGSLNLVNIQSKKVELSLAKVKDYRFSPTGKMLFVSHWNNDKPCEILSFCNDVTP